MKIQEIYQKYQIPSNLQRHMLEVTAVGKFVTDHWRGPEIDGAIIIRTLLLHDLANIVKFKPPYLSWTEAETPKWLEIQAEFIAKYGSDAHEATEKIIHEINPDRKDEILEAFACIGWHQAGEPSLEGRICDFADCCVSPKGIVGWRERLDDLVARYGDEKRLNIQKSLENIEFLQKFFEFSETDLLREGWKKYFPNLESSNI